MQTQYLRAVSLSALVLGLIWAAGCGSGASDEAPPEASISSSRVEAPSETSSPEHLTAAPSVSQGAVGKAASAPTAPPREAHPEVRIETNQGEIRVKLDAEKAPQTVDNFLLNYVERGFYEGTIFHYVEEDFIAVAGGYTAELEPKETRTPIRNEARNSLKNVRGTIAMSRHGDFADSATSQFFFNLADNAALDFEETEDGHTNGYCVFGKIVSGMDVLDRIASVEVHDVEHFPNVPVEPIVIKSIERLD